MNKNEKTGITLVVLVITIIVLAILLATVIVPSSNLIDTSSIAAFNKTIINIHDLSITYNVTTGKWPVKSGSALTYSDLYNLVLDKSGAQAAQKFEVQIASNGDQNSNFYYIDFAKINVTQGGLDLDGNIVINGDGTHVYYVPGMFISENWYFTNYTSN